LLALTEHGKVSHPGRMILGSGRSGTTWVLDALARANRLRPIFEPLHEEESSVGSRYAYSRLRPDDIEDSLEQFLIDCVRRRDLSRWVDFRGPRRLLHPPLRSLNSMKALKGVVRNWRKHQRRKKELMPLSRNSTPLFKCIRANLMAGWLVRRLGFRTVMLVRHPGAVVESMKRIRGPWRPEEVLARYRSDTRLHEWTNGRYENLLSRQLTHVESLTLTWVIENQHPVMCANEDGYSVVYYEDLVEMREPAWSLILAALQLERRPEADDLAEPSMSSSRTQSAPGSLPNSHNHWRRSIDSHECQEMQSILESTGCELYEIAADRPCTVAA
jgi:hypothetical protein